MAKIELIYVRLDERGRLTIPLDVRERLELKEGDYVSITIQKASEAGKQ